MRTITENYYPATHQKIVPGSTATGLDSDTVKPLGDKSLRFTGGGVLTIPVDGILTGATGGATAIVAGVVLETGTFGAGTAQGVLYLNDQVGTFEAENLDLTGAATQANIATITGDSVDISFAKNKHAQKALVSADAQTIAFTVDGTTPTVSGGTRIGHPLPTTRSIVLETPDEVHNFLCIDHTDASAGYVQVTCYFERGKNVD